MSALGCDHCQFASVPRGGCHMCAAPTRRSLMSEHTNEGVEHRHGTRSRPRRPSLHHRTGEASMSIVSCGTCGAEAPVVMVNGRETPETCPDCGDPLWEDDEPSLHHRTGEASMSEFQREERYIVVKRKHLPPAADRAIKRIARQYGNGTVECVVIESDWPEYEPVWAMLRSRCTPSEQKNDRTWPECLDPNAAHNRRSAVDTCPKCGGRAWLESLPPKCMKCGYSDAEQER